jgi:hypothetical protein
MVTMSAVRADFRKQGWSRQRGSLDDVRRAASLDGLRGAASRSGSNERVLVPHDELRAPRNSLSAKYGLGEQPLHSDGAHLRLPPDVVVLHAAQPTLTSTVVWAPSYEAPNVLPVVAWHGVFTVRGNGDTFLASVWDRDGLRFDPVVMSPGDAFARETVEYLTQARPRAHVHEWDEPDLLLFIDNRRALHARDEVLDPSTRSLSRLSYQWGEAS